MARANIELIEALRKTAKSLQNGAPYQWGHMGSCNCGNLAQELLKMSKGEIHQIAMSRYGDWTEQSAEYCPTSGYPIDEMISSLLKKGLDADDLKHLEKLSDKEVLARLPEDRKYPKHNLRDDVVLYMQTWANVLEEELLSNITLPEVEMQVDSHS
jgi:hypothetical protein